ncbi:MAG: hypothetical protein HYY66_08385 [Candidatus Tectomicrobia bacterium]|nr:hypothetical protein [Candidatus Tectomicrobia bacterium]
MKEVLNVRETQRRETAGLFSNIWRSMFDALVQAKRVFVIGYSFPSTDHHLRTLLRLVNERKNGGYEEVHCCTMADGKEAEVFDGARKLFPCANEPHLDASGFGKFVQD